MKPLLLTSCFLFFCFDATSSAQVLVGGRKMLAGKDGGIVAPTPAAPLPIAPLVGGSDTCATPDPITGTGSFAFDNTVASSGPEAQAESICYVWNTMQINNDVWFHWTASFTGNAEVILCGGTSFDTRVAVYAGAGCPAPGSALACNDDYCGLVSRVNFLCTSGNSYVIQVGTYPGVAGSTGSFSINQFNAPPGDDCGAPVVLPGPGTYGFDTLLASSSFQGQAESMCVAFNTTQIADDTWFSYTAAVSGTATVTSCGLTLGPSNDTRIAAYQGTGCPAQGTAIACNDDDAACAVGLNSTINFAVSCGQTYLIQVGRYPNSGASVLGQIMLSESGGPCASPTVPYCFGDGTGAPCPCANNGAAGNGCASSVNPNGANLATSGQSDLANDTLVLHGTGMPNSSALYFQGTTQIGTAFGDGLRCAGGVVTRLSTKTNAAGASQFPAAGDPSVHVKGNVLAAGTRTYQVWYRNAAAFCTASTFNLSNGVLVTWQ
jgi:hypothetical protein